MTGCVAAHVASCAWLGFSCRKVEVPEASKMGLGAAATFVVSTIQFPILGVPMHLGLYGLLGIVLQRRAFPVLYASLLFQALLLQHGGLLSLGVNALNMGSGALIGWGAWRFLPVPLPVRSVAAGFLGAMVPVLLLAWEFELADYGRGLFAVAGVLAGVAVLEAAVTLLAVGFFERVKPEILLPQQR